MNKNIKLAILITLAVICILFLLNVGGWSLSRFNIYILNLLKGKLTL